MSNPRSDGDPAPPGTRADEGSSAEPAAAPAPLANQADVAGSHDRYFDLYELAPVGYVTLTTDGRIREANRAAAELLGVERRMLAQVELSRFVAAGSRDEYDRKYQRLVSGETRQSCELEIHRADGTPMALRMESAAFGAAADRWFGAVLIDITERRRIKDALMSSEERLRTILDTAADAIVTINREGIVQSFNRAAEQMFGYAADEVIGQNVKILMPPPYCEEHDGYLKRYLQTGVKRVIGIGREVLGLRKDGTTFPVELAVSQIDHINVFTGFLRDISRRKQLEREVLETASLERKRIGQDLHDSIGQQLTGLVLMAEALRESAGESPQLSAQADRLRTGLENVLGDIRVICRGLTPVHIHSDGLVAALEQLVADVSCQSSVPCSFHCSGPVKVSDIVVATHLFNIAQGALSNAQRHANAHQIQVRLEQTNVQLTLSIRDDGTGLPPLGRDGLGMRIMHNRASIIGGSLVIRSVQPSGTEVSCIVPNVDHRPPPDARFPGSYGDSTVTAAE